MEALSLEVTHWRTRTLKKTVVLYVVSQLD